MSKMTVLMNKGPRTYSLKDGVDKEGKAVKRTLPPGGSIEALDEQEATHYLGYRDIVDAAKAVPAVTDRIQELEKEKAEFLARIADLEAQLGTQDKDEKAEAHGKGKGKK